MTLDKNDEIVLVAVGAASVALLLWWLANQGSSASDTATPAVPGVSPAASPSYAPATFNIGATPGAGAPLAAAPGVGGIDIGGLTLNFPTAGATSGGTTADGGTSGSCGCSGGGTTYGSAGSASGDNSPLSQLVAYTFGQLPSSAQATDSGSSTTDGAAALLQVAVNYGDQLAAAARIAATPMWA